MPVETLLTAAFELMVLGMGTVFVILGLMIVCMTILMRIAPQEEISPAVATIPPASTDTSLIAAIQSAIHLYRNRHSNNTTA